MSAPETPLGLLEVAASTEAAAADLRAMLEGSEREELRARAGAVPTVAIHDAVQVAFVGQHNSGKSSLLRCLTGREDIPVGTDVVTNRTATYEWHGHVLVDTPGVLAGVNESHDRLADMAIKAADVVAFVVTAEGFDDLVADYFHIVRKRVQSAGQLIVVVNKTSSEDSEPDEVETHLRTVIGDLYDLLPVVWTDAEDWLLADRYPDPSRRRSSSNIPALASALTEITRRRGAHLRLATPIRELSAFVRDCLDAVTTGEGEDPVLAGLDEAERAIGSERDQMLDAVDSVSRRVRQRLREDLIAAGPATSDERLAEIIDRRRDEFDDGFVEEGERAAESLSKELVLYQPPLPVKSDGSTLAHRESPELLSWNSVRDSLLNGLQWVAREFGGKGAHAEGTGNVIVKRAWHAVGGKFRPWGAVKASRNVSRAAKVLGPALVIGEGLFDAHRQWTQANQSRQAAEQQDAWNRHCLDMSTQLTDGWAAAARLGVEEYCEAQIASVNRQRLSVMAKLANDDEETRRLLELGTELDELMDRLMGPPETGGDSDDPGADG